MKVYLVQTDGAELMTENQLRSFIEEELEYENNITLSHVFEALGIENLDTNESINYKDLSGVNAKDLIRIIDIAHCGWFVDEYEISIPDECIIKKLN